jgi:hypothetical protein
LHDLHDDRSARDRPRRTTIGAELEQLGQADLGGVIRVQDRLERRVKRGKRQDAAVVKDHQKTIHATEESAVVRHGHDGALEALERFLERLR